MHARSSGSASPGVRDRLRLEWEVGLQRLPFFTQRLAVVLLGLLVVSLALIGGMAILWGGQQGSDLQLRPPPGAGRPSGPSGPEPLGPEAPAQGVAGDAASRDGGGRDGGQDGMQSLVGAREASSTTSGLSAGPGSTQRPAPAAPGGQAPPTTAPTTTTPTTEEPPPTDGGVLGPLPLPTVLSTLLE